MSMMSSVFFKVAERADGSLEINFLTKYMSPTGAEGEKVEDRINIFPAWYEEFRALAEHVKGRTVVVTGRGPVEGYFAIGYYAELGGASKIVFEGVNGAPRITMPSSATKPSSKCWLQFGHKDAEICVSILKPANSDGKWSMEEIDYLTPVLLPEPSGRITFTGPGAVGMYLLLGVSAARAGHVDVCVVKPGIPYAIRFTPDHAGETIAVSSEKKGVVVGIIGDPNSGKSVFSRAFYMALRYSMPAQFESWIYDCDLASPTPDWYCSALVSADTKVVEDYKAVRDTMKVRWNPSMEMRCANDLGVLRTNLDVVIADLPGGKHKDGNGPLSNPIRIDNSPASRRVDMFRQCDAFILICRKDKREAIFKGWFDALAAIGLQHRLVAVLDSSDPDADFSMSPLVRDGQGILRGDIRGLDRKHPAGETGRKLAENIQPLVKAFISTR